MARRMTFDIVSDVMCPWCVIGLRGLEIALARVGDLVAPELRLQPFELNPDMAREGEPVAEHVRRKYGRAPSPDAREAMRAQAEAVGFAMRSGPESRIWNSFDAHRLLEWARGEGKQIALGHALFAAHFTENEDMGDAMVLARAAVAAGLDGATALAVVLRGEQAVEVRAAQRHWRAEGITAVPTIVVDDRYVIAGAHPPEAYERAIRRIAADADQSVSA